MEFLTIVEKGLNMIERSSKSVKYDKALTNKNEAIYSMRDQK